MELEGGATAWRRIWAGGNLFYFVLYKSWSCYPGGYSTLFYFRIRSPSRASTYSYYSKGLSALKKESTL